MNVVLSIIITNFIITLLDYNLIKKNSKKISEIQYLNQKFKKNISSKKKNSLIICLINGFIISLASNFIYYINIPFIISFPLSFLLILILITIFYNHLLIFFMK